jgi:hypothetical protein
MKNYFDLINDVEYVNLRPYLDVAYNDYQYYVANNELTKLSAKDQKNLNIHFILTQIFFVCKESKHKKCFYYQQQPGNNSEFRLVRLIFNSLPSRFIVNDQSFEDFVKGDCEYYPYVPVDTSKISWKKFKSFLKKQNLTVLEKNFTKNNNVKLSLIH